MYLTNENGLTSPEIFEGYVHSELLLSCYFSETTVDAEGLYFSSSKSFSQDLRVNIASCYQSQLAPHFHSLYLYNYKNTAPATSLRKPSAIN